MAALLSTAAFVISSMPAELTTAVSSIDWSDLYLEEGSYTLGTSFSDDAVEINDVTFPDPTFRSYVSENFDTDKSGGLSETEIYSATNVFIAGTLDNRGSISSLAGIEYLTNLQYLYCNCNQISSLDLSQNTALTYMDCSFNKLTVLDLSENTALTSINCDNNQLASLDISRSTALTVLNCSENKLTALDVSRNTALTSLYCYNNQLSSLALSNNTALTSINCSNNQLSSLDISNNSALTSISCENNQLSSLDISRSTALTYLSCNENKLTTLDVSRNTALTSLYCYNNQLSSLDLSNNTALTSINCGSNQLTSLDISRNTALIVLNCGENKLTTLDVSRNTALTELYCLNNQLAYLDLSCNKDSNALTLAAFNNIYPIGNVIDSYSLKDLPAGFDPSKASNWSGAVYDPETDSLKDFNDYNANISYEYDCGNGHTETFYLRTDSVSYSDIVAIDDAHFPDETFRQYISENFDTNKSGGLSKDEIKNAAYINVAPYNMGGTYDQKGNIKDLTGIEYFTYLTNLDCSRNQLTELDISKNTALTNLNCYDNQLPELDVSKNTHLFAIDCGNNYLTNLDVSQNTSLAVLSCYNNQLTELDLSKNTNLTNLNCYNNKLTKLDLSQNTALEDLSCFNNQLTEFELSQNTALTNLYCYSNKLATLDLNENIALTSINCSDNNIETIDVRNCTALTYLECGSNNLTELDLSQNTALTDLNCYGNKLATLDLSQNKALTSINCSSNNFEAIDVRNCTALKNLFCESNKLTALDVSSNTSLEVLHCNLNQLTELDVSKNTALTNIWCFNNNLAFVDLTANTLLTSTSCEGNVYFIGDVTDSYPLSDIHGFDPDKASGWHGAEYDKGTNSLKNFTGSKVTYIYECSSGYSTSFTILTGTIYESDILTIDENAFPDDTFRKYISDNFDTDKSGGLSRSEINAVKTIDVSGTYEKPGTVKSLKGIEVFTLLTNLSCNYNELTDIDVSQNHSLVCLNIVNNKLTKLDVSQNTSLSSLYFSGNNVSEIDLSNNLDIGWLALVGNPISKLDLSSQKYLYAVSFAHCRLTSLDLSNCQSTPYIYSDYNRYVINTDGTSFPLSELPEGFDPSKASDWNGAEYDSSTNTLKNITSGIITYNYDCGKGLTFKCSLINESAPSYTVTFDEKILAFSDNFGYYISSGETSPSGSVIYVNIALQDYIDHKVMLNGEEITLSPTDSGYMYSYKYTVGSEDISITTEESKWSDEKMSEFAVLNADDNIRVYWYNANTNYISNMTPIANGSYIPKGSKVCIRVSSSLYSEMPKLYINDDFKLSSLNNDGDWQLWGTDVPYNDEFRVKINGIISDDPSVEINEQNFPDPVFRQYVLDNVDTNKDSCLSDKEIIGVSILDISGTEEKRSSIKSLKGLEYLTEITFLSCSYMDITSIDVSRMHNLQFLFCLDDKLTSIDVSHNPQLTFLHVSGTDITELDVSKNTELENLYCENTKLTYLDVSSNTKLKSLGIGYANFTSIDLSNTAVSNFYYEGNSYNIGEVKTSFSLDTLPNFDPLKASDWNGAEYDSASNSLINFTSRTVTYTYDCGNGHKAEFTLVTGNTPSFSITVQPEDSEVIEGLDISLEITAEGTEPEYQWQRYNGSEWTDLDGETSSKLVLSNVDENAKYRCIVKSGDETVTSREASITVKAAEDVTEDEVSALSISDTVKFVNAFTGKSTNDSIILTSAQMKAIERVLENDLK